jgi:glycerol-3-phosphate dehydrogenase subunit C
LNNKVAFFSGCTCNYSSPEIGQASVLVMEKNGLRPVFPSQTCCAIPQLFYGDLHSFYRHAEANVRSLAAADCDIVTGCTTCALALKRDYPARLKSPAARAVAARTYDILEYLVLLYQRGCLDISFQPVRFNLVYHAPCHLKVLGEDLIANRLQLLKLIPGVSVTRIDHGCCGMAGTFGIKKKNYSLSLAIGEPLFAEIKRLEPNRVITECPGCTMQIKQGTGLSVFHPLLIFRQAYGL